MIQFLAIFFPVLLAAVAQSSLFPLWFPVGVAPDALLMILVFWVSRFPSERIWFRAIFLGIAADLVSFFPFGTSVVSFSLVSFGLSSLAKRFLVGRQTWNSPALWGLIVAATLGNATFLFFLGKIVSYSPNHLEHLDFIAPWNARVWLRIIPNALFLFMIYQPMVKLERLAAFHKQKRM
jgi:rod shape-determining protein MreD